MPEPRLGVCLVGIVDQDLVESCPQMHIEMIHQVVFALEVREQRSFRHSCGFRDCRSWSAQISPLGKNTQSGIQDRGSFVITFWPGQGGPFSRLIIERLLSHF
jgi:hypothetical protein